MADPQKEFFKEIKSEFQEIGSKVNKMFDELVRGKKEQGEFAVAADVYQEGQKMYFVLDLPGFLKQDVRVQLRDNTLVIRGDRSGDEDTSGRKYLINERKNGFFERSFSLPAGVEAQSIKAKFENGLLIVAIDMDTDGWEENSIEIE